MTDTKPESDPQFNLEHYLKNLTLQPMVHGKRAPPMPPKNGRSKLMSLAMRPGGYRNLQEIKRLNCLEDEATLFFNNLQNCEAVKALKLMSQVSTQDVKNSFFFNPYEVEANSGALFIIERAPIRSVQQLVHTINPDLHDLGFHTPLRCGNISAQRIEPAYFCNVDGEGTMDFIKCIIVALSPWEFAPRDFEDFTTMNMFEDGCLSSDGMGNTPSWCNADRMWAYLHDLCLSHDCHNFVLTTYEQWAFGAFSNYYTAGFVSQTTQWDAKPNSVLELFTYWILDACRTNNTMMMEKVPREKNFDPDILEQARHMCRERFAKDKYLAAGLNLITDESRPRKRVRKDPLEDRTGWEPLNHHADALFPSPTRAYFSSPLKSLPSKSTALGSIRELWSDTEEDDGDMFAKPSPKWNRWLKRKRETEDKENPSENLEAHLQNDKVLDQAPKLATRPQFGHPIPCYSSDIDRDNDRFRPELIRLMSFPISTPKPPYP